MYLWSNIGEIGNDVNTTSSWLTPSIVFEGVDFRSPTQPSASWRRGVKKEELKTDLTLD